MLFCCLLIFSKSQIIFFKIYFFNKFIQDYNQNFKQFGSINVVSDLDQNCFTLMLFLKDIFSKKLN